jgi:hypothetical protein
MGLFLNDTIGYPPRSHISDSEIINSMPVVEITPSKPYFESGLTLFRVSADWEKYDKILKNQDPSFSTPSKPLRFAYIADSFPTDAFTNEYGETFLQKITDVASQGIGDLVQMTGSKTIGEALEKVGKGTVSVGEKVGGMIGEGLKQAGGMAASLGLGATNLIKEMESSQTSLGKTIGGGLAVAHGLASNHRIDFPMVWKNSSFTPAYSLTIRLWNPNPSRYDSLNNFIIYPLAVILCLALPTTENGFSFSYPFFHRVVSKGIFTLDPAVITNISVIKGGDQQQIGHNQFLGMVDVRIDFAGLFTSMVLEENGRVPGDRPTLKKYLDALREPKYNTRSRKDLRIASETQSGGVAGDFLPTAPPPLDIIINKQLGVTEEKPSPELYKARVEYQTAEIESRLISQPGTEDLYETPEERILDLRS